MLYIQSHSPTMYFMTVNDVKSRVSLGETKCWHLSCKSLGGSGFCMLSSNVRPTYAFEYVGVSFLRAPLGEGHIIWNCLLNQG